MPSLIELLKKPTDEIKSAWDVSGLNPTTIATKKGQKGVGLNIPPVIVLGKKISFQTLNDAVNSDTSGVNSLWLKNQPLLYGSEIVRLTTNKTQTVSEMVNSTGEANNGLLGGITTAIGSVANKIGGALGFGEKIIPTRLSKRNEFIKALENDVSSLPEVLGKISDKAEGSIVGKFLKQTAKGRPDEIGRRATGTLTNAAQNAATNLLFGNNKVGQNEVKAIETLSLKPDNLSYGSKNPYTKIFDYNSKDEQTLGLSNYLNKLQDGKEIVDEDSVLSSQIANFPKFSTGVIGKGIPTKRDKTNSYTDSSEITYQNNISISKFRNKTDSINASSIWKSEDGTPANFADNTTLDDYDFIPLRFYSVARKVGASFKATLSALTENFTPSWEANNFIGNPYSYYTYQTIGRDVAFNFVVYSLNDTEHSKIWEKIDFLSSLTYPQNKTTDTYVTPPLLKMTLGNMYKNKLGFIDSLSYTIDDNTPWEIGLTANTDGTTITGLSNTGTLKDYKLPTMINVSMTYKFVETASEIAGKKLYHYGGTDRTFTNWESTDIESDQPIVRLKQYPVPTPSTPSTTSRIQGAE